MDEITRFSRIKCIFYTVAGEMFNAMHCCKSQLHPTTTKHNAKCNAFVRIAIGIYLLLFYRIEKIDATTNKSQASTHQHVYENRTANVTIVIMSMNLFTCVLEYGLYLM